MDWVVRRLPAGACASACVAALALLATGPANAGLRKVPPTAFTPKTTGSYYQKNYIAIGVPTAAPGAASFTAPIRLPAGARVTGVTLYYDANTVGDVDAELVFVDPADAVSAPVFVAWGSSVDVTSSEPKLQDLTVSTNPAVTLIRGRYNYLVNADIDPGGYIWEVRVRYVGP